MSGEQASGTKSVLSGVITDKGYDLSKEAALQPDVTLEAAQQRVRELLLELDRYDVRAACIMWHARV